jgi:hypothetical protein
MPKDADWHTKAGILLKMINKLSFLEWTVQRKADDRLVLSCAGEEVSGPTPAEHACWLLGGMLLTYTRLDQEAEASTMEIGYAGKTKKTKVLN